MVVEPTVQRFDPTKPVTGTRFHSEDMRANFQAVSRANDLRCTQQNPPDLTVFVEAGAYAISSQQTQHFIGGNSPILDTVTGSNPGWQRVSVLELDSVGSLIWNNGSWVPVGPTAPPYTDQRIPLCEVTVTAGDLYIPQSNIVDVRPMINLGVGLAQLVTPGQVTLTATIPAQTDFDTSSQFHFFPGQHEILVWSDVPSTSCSLTPTTCNSLLFRIVNIDYIELDDHTIRFLPPYTFAPGDRVVIWKIGLSATPGKFSFDDLSDVSVANAGDFGDRGAALVPRTPGDVPSGINPYQTLYSHNHINHLDSVAIPSMAPVVTHLTTIATNAAHRHHAVEIEVSQPLLFDVTATDVQTALHSISTNFYGSAGLSGFRKEHFADGSHGPKVTVTQTAADNALLISKGIGGGNVVDVTNAGTGYGLVVNQNGEATGLAVTKTGSGNSPAILITNSGTGDGAGLRVYQLGDAAGVRVEKSNTGSGPAVEVFSTNGGAGIAVVQSGTATGSHGITVSQSTGGSSLLINHLVPGQDAVVITRNTSGPKSAVIINQSHTGSANSALIVNNSGSLYAIHAENYTPAVTAAVIRIDNLSSGYDIQGSNGYWSIDKLGNILTGIPILPPGGGSVSVGSDLSVVRNSYLTKSTADGGTGGYFRFGVGPDLTVVQNAHPGEDGYIVCTHPVHRINCHGTGLRWIYWGSFGSYPPIGTVVRLTGVSGQTMFPRIDGTGSNQLRDENVFWGSVIEYMWMGDYWRDLMSR